MSNKIKFNQLTLGEIKLLETISGTALADLSSGKIGGELLTALGVIGLRRNGNPAANVSDAEALTIEQVTGMYAELGDNDNDGEVYRPESMPAAARILG